MNWLKGLAQRELRALIALAFSILGTMALTGIVCWIVWILWLGGWAPATALARIDKIGLIAILITVIMGVSMIGLQLAINRRQLKGSAFGASFEASGGDEVAPAVTTTTTTSTVAVPVPSEDSKP